MFRPTLARAWVTALALATIPALAHAGDRWDLSRYQKPAFRDSILARYDAPGVVVLDRAFVEVKAKGASANADVQHDYVLFVREPERLGAYGTIAFDEFPGRDFHDIKAYRVTADDRDELDVDDDAPYACDLYHDQKRHVVKIESLEPGDVIAVRVRYTIERQNPVLVHAFDRELPVIQSDITFDVSKSLLEGKTPGVFAWWAGSFPGHIGQMVWEKPQSYRFRWGEADISPRRDGERSVLTAWAFDPSRTMLGKLVFSEGQARGSDDISYRGKNLGASQLTGMDHGSRTYGIAEEESHRPTEASYGEIYWEDVAQLFADTQIRERVEERYLPKLVAKMMRGAGRRDVVEHLVAAVHEKVSVIDVPLAIAINDLHRPMETYDSGCASAIDKALCMVGVLRTQDVRAYPVLLKRSRLVTELHSVETFDEVGVIVSSPGGNRFVDMKTGRIHDRMPSGWAAALTMPIDETPQILLGDDVAALANRANG